MHQTRFVSQLTKWHVLQCQQFCICCQSIKIVNLGNWNRSSKRKKSIQKVDQRKARQSLQERRKLHQRLWTQGRLRRWLDNRVRLHLRQPRLEKEIRPETPDGQRRSRREEAKDKKIQEGAQDKSKQGQRHREGQSQELRRCKEEVNSCCHLNIWIVIILLAGFGWWSSIFIVLQPLFYFFKLLFYYLLQNFI